MRVNGVPDTQTNQQGWLRRTKDWTQRVFDAEIERQTNRHLLAGTPSFLRPWAEAPVALFVVGWVDFLAGLVAFIIIQK